MNTIPTDRTIKRCKDEHRDEQRAAELPPWMQSMQAAMAEAIKPDDLKAVMAAQVKKAVDEGDVKSARFVFDQAARLASPKGMTIIQNNNFFSDQNAAPADQPTRATPGSSSKIDLMRRRLEAGEPLTRDDDAGGDGDGVDLS